MKKMVQKMICSIVLVLFAFSAAAEGIVFPENISVIDTEVFFETASIQHVYIPETVTEIRGKAFAYSGVKTVYIPKSVEYIADDAFMGCEDPVLTVQKGSYAHEWAAIHHAEYVLASGDEQIEQKESYHLDALKSCVSDEGTNFSVTAYTKEMCLLKISVLNDSTEQQITSYQWEVQAGLNGVLLSLNSEETLPEYYILEAVLTNEDGNPLCTVVRDITHSRAYVQANQATKEDYEADRVMDYGETGFVVLSSDVICIHEEATQEGRSFTFSLPANAKNTHGVYQAGDIFMLNVGGTPTPVKAASVTLNSDYTVTVEKDNEMYLNEVYDKIDISVTLDPEDQSVTTETGNVFNHKETYSFADGALTLFIDSGMSVNVVAKYDKVNLGPDYFLFDTQARVWGTGLATLSGKFPPESKDEEDETNEPLYEIALFEGVVVIPGLNLPANLAVTIPINLTAEATGTVDVEFDKSFGFSWDTDNGFSKKEEEGINQAKAMLEIDFNANIGPEVELSLGLWEFFRASIDASLKVEAIGHYYAKAEIGDKDELVQEEVHACDSCLSTDVNLIAEANASITYKIGKETKDFLPEKNIFNFKKDLKDFYISFKNETDGPFGGKITEGEGICPNRKYQVEVYTLDYQEKMVSGIEVVLTREDGVSERIKSPCTLYLYNGKYIAEASFESGKFDKHFTVDQESKQIYIEESEMTLSGKITDNRNGKPLEGAQVELTLPDGKVKTIYTGSDGKFSFHGLPGGTYGIKISKEHFKEKSFENINYAPGTTNTFNAELKFNGELEYIYVEYVSNNGQWQKLSTGTGAYEEGVPEVYLRALKKNDRITTLSVRHEACDKTFDVDIECKSFYFAGMSGKNMDQEYVFNLGTEYESINGGAASANYIIRVVDGEFECLKAFKDGSASLLEEWNVEAVFNDSNVCEGTVYPSGRKFVIKTKDSNASRIGTKLYVKPEAYTYGHVNSMTSLYYNFGKEIEFATIKNVYDMKNGELVLVSQEISCASGVGTVTYP